MTIKTYKIKNPSPEIVDYFMNLPNRIEINTKGNEVEASVDHIDTNDEIKFQTDLGKRLGIQVDGTPTNIAHFIDEIKTDQLFYITENSVTKTNIGTTYTNIFTDYGGRPFGIDTTGFTKMALHILWNNIGTGTQTIRIVNDADNTQVLESPALAAGATINRFNNVSIPVGFIDFIGNWRLQAKSTVAADDPVFNGIRIYLRR